MSNEILTNTIFELTKAVYRVTELFPQNEVLKNQIRQKANDILSLASVYHLHNNNLSERKRLIYNVISNVSIINVYFQFSKIQEFAHPVNFDVLENEYLKLSDFFRTEITKNGSNNEISEITDNNKLLSDRQEQILSYIQEKTKAQISDLSLLLDSQCSEKTIRRDLQKLMDCGLVNQVGDRRWTTYILNS